MRVKIAFGGFSFLLIMLIMLSIGLPGLISVIANQPENDNKSIELQHTVIFLEEFNYQNPDWYFMDILDDHKKSLSIRDGFLFLNLTDQVTSDSQTRIYINDYAEGRGRRWLYVGIEIRLKCSEDDGLGGGIGKGTRAWGLMDENMRTAPHNGLFFGYNSAEMKYPGFFAMSDKNNTRVRNDTRVRNPIEGLDLSDWHNYTILWGYENATFYIDDQIVATTSEVPTTPLSIAIHMENFHKREGGDGIYGGFYFFDLEHNQSIQVDYIRVFAMNDRLEDDYQRIQRLLANVSRQIEAATDSGLNTTQIWVEQTHLENEWNDRGYVNVERFNEHVERISYIPELIILFQEAKEALASNDIEKRLVIPLNLALERAEEAWLELDLPRAKGILDYIIEQTSGSNG
jgi:hypothetical protein